jgi:hypothetical protein
MTMARPVRMPGRTKYRAVRTVVDGISFASKKEARRYSELKLMEKAGEIRDLCLQPRYVLNVNNVKVTTYVADFEYWTGNRRIVEDCKGFRTDVYRLKAKLMDALYGIKIVET